MEGSDRFTVPARSEKVVTYTVTVPPNATPGGHYGAIFFNNPGQGSNGNAVNMVRRIGMLYLIKVPGDIVVKTDLGDILIDIPEFNSAPNIWDRLKRNFKDMNAWTDVVRELNPHWERPTLSKTNFQVTLNIPVQNDGNIHIKPTGKIYIYDQEVMLKNIGKESIVDENGVFKGERIVDYLPINDEGGNVLPDSERVFKIDWLGFATKDVDDSGNAIIAFESPSDYFARQSGGDIQVLYPWEKLSVRNTTRNLTAKVEFSYNNPQTGANEVVTRELPLDISYNYIAKTTNWGMILIIVGVIFFAWILIRRRDNTIEDLEDELDDEIAALEKAQRALLKKGAVPAKKKKPVTAPVVEKPTKKPVTKTPTAKKKNEVSVAAPKTVPKTTKTVSKVEAVAEKKTPVKKPATKVAATPPKVPAPKKAPTPRKTTKKPVPSPETSTPS